MMNETERIIYRLLCGWRKLLAEKGFFESRDDLRARSKQERMEQIDRLLMLLETLTLTADERYVVKRHLADGVDWNRIQYEYNHKLLRPATKSRSTLRRLQSTAIGKMARHIEKDADSALATEPAVLLALGL